MTMQIRETMIYRGEQYSLRSCPLDSFLETRTDISFAGYTTAHSRGYQGYWKLEENKLFLTELTSSNYTFFDIFNSHEPVLADWYSGILTFGFGEINFKEWNTYYENYLWLNIKDGIIKERKIVKEVNDDFKIDFGKYNERKLSEVLKGKINTTYNLEYLWKDFLEDIISFFIKEDFIKKIDVPYFNITETTKTLYKDLKGIYINYLLTKNFLAFDKHFYINASGEEEETEKFSKLLEEILISDFRINRTLDKNNFPNAEVSENTFLINPDINYLEWAINKVGKFCIPPHVIENIKELKYLRHFLVKRLNSTIFEYSPVIETVNFNLNQHTKSKNLEKFQAKFNVIYDIENNIYVHNLSGEDLLKKFGFYLDENFEESMKDDYPVDYGENQHQYESDRDYESDYFDAMTDGQLGDYDDFTERGGNIDDIDTWARG